MVLEKSRIRLWETYLIAVIASSTFTTPLQMREGSMSRIVLIGRTINIRAAIDLFEYLHPVVLILGRAERYRVAHLDSFRTGIVHRLGERLLDKGPPVSPDDTRALVVQMEAQTNKENKGFMSEKYGSTKEKKVARRVDANSYHHGRAVGDRVSLNKQIVP